MSDLLSSSRGPGVIGLVLALIVLLGFGGLAFVVLEDKSGGKGVNGQIKENEKHIRILNRQLEEWQEKADEYADNRKTSDKLLKTRVMLKSKQATVKSASDKLMEAKVSLAATEKKFQDYKHAYRTAERARAVGEKIPKLTIKNGKTYEEVVIRRVFEEGIDIRHKIGGTLIKLELIPDDLKDRFQYTDEDEAVTNKLRSDRLKIAKQGAAAYAKSLKLNAIKEKISSRKYDLSKITKSIAESESSIASLKSSAERARRKASEYRTKHSRAIAAGRRSMNSALAQREDRKATSYLNKANSLNGSISRKRKDASKIQSEIRVLESELRKKTSEKP